MFGTAPGYEKRAPQWRPLFVDRDRWRAGYSGSSGSPLRFHSCQPPLRAETLEYPLCIKVSATLALVAWLTQAQ
jgi:hypothetical protein